jgi:hypothetical protein
MFFRSRPVSAALSIFEKVCPACATSVASDAGRCDCGHRFEDETTPLLSDIETVAREEELYETYLVARVTQARLNLNEAVHMLDAERDNQEKRDAVELNRQVLASIEADLVNQREKLARARQALAALTQSQQQPVARKPSSQATPKPAAAAKPAAAKPTAKPAAKPAAPAVAPMKVAATPSSQPSLAFRVAQAAKAKQILEQAKVMRQVETTPPTQGAPAAFKALQALKAAKLAEQSVSQVKTKECPHCTAALELSTARCRCGYSFPTGADDLPTLTLSPDEVAAISQAFGPLGTDSPRRKN